MSGLVVSLLSLSLSGPAKAQPMDYDGMFNSERRGERDEKAPKPPRVVPFAAALFGALKPEDWLSIKVSTASAMEKLTLYLREGMYRQELVTLVLLAKKGGRPLEELVKRRTGGAALRSLAADLHIDYPPLYEEARDMTRTLSVHTSTAPAAVVVSGAPVSISTPTVSVSTPAVSVSTPPAGSK